MFKKVKEFSGERFKDVLKGQAIPSVYEYLGYGTTLMLEDADIENILLSNIEVGSIKLTSYVGGETEMAFLHRVSNDLLVLATFSVSLFSFNPSEENQPKVFLHAMVLNEDAVRIVNEALDFRKSEYPRVKPITLEDLKTGNVHIDTLMIGFEDLIDTFDDLGNPSFDEYSIPKDYLYFAGYEK